MNCKGVTDWRRVGRNLGLTDSKLNQIQEENWHHVGTTHQYVRSVIREWLRASPDVRTEKRVLERLADTLEKCGEYPAAESMYSKAGGCMASL